jgi:hypothetical protein
LVTLGERGANPTVQKAVALLAAARSEGEKPAAIVVRAVVLAGHTNEAAASLTSTAWLRNLEIAQKLGCLHEAGLEEMRHGNAATITRGPYKGDQLSVDHIILHGVVPELDKVIANLELMPLRMNKRKRAAIGDRQRALARQLFNAGLLSKAGSARAVGRSLMFYWDELLDCIALKRNIVPIIGCDLMTVPGDDGRPTPFSASLARRCADLLREQDLDVPADTPL